MVKVIQYHSSVIGEDAIGGSIQILHAALEHAGLESYIACRDNALGISVQGALPASGLLAAHLGTSLHSDDVLLIHFSFNDDIAEDLARLPIKKIIVFHNVTPSSFFREVGQAEIAIACDEARNQFGRLSSYFDGSVGDSEFNSGELTNASYPAVETIPVLLDIERFGSDELELELLGRIKDSASVNILFVGRFVPNKRIERVISAAAHFRASFPMKIKLHLVGKIWDQNYFASIIDYAASVDALDLIQFHIHADQLMLRTLYAAADAFVCMSDHEGFMVPIVEAFAAACPVIGLRRTAVGETMGEAGLLIDQPDPELVAGLIYAIKTDANLRNRIIWSQGRRLAAFSPRRAV